MTSFGVADIGSDDRDYDNWLTTLTQASVRLEVLQTVVTELCQLCEKKDVIQSRQDSFALRRRLAEAVAAHYGGQHEISGR